MDDIEQIKQRRLLELQQKNIQNQINQQQKFQTQVDALEDLARRVLSKEALARYGNIKSAHPELAMKILVVIAQIMQQTNVKELTDEQFKEVLQHIIPEKRETKITFK